MHMQICMRSSPLAFAARMRAAAVLTKDVRGMGGGCPSGVADSEAGLGGEDYLAVHIRRGVDRKYEVRPQRPLLLVHA